MSNELGQFIPLHYHYQMLSDKNRMDAFTAAIADVVLSSHRVVDLGSGTGVLSYNAAQKGANVQSVEYNPAMVDCSRQLIAKNPTVGNVEVIHANAAEWMSDEPVDVVICEMLHSALIREKQVEVISRFRDEHFKRFGKTPVFMPTATLLAVQPVLQDYDFAGFHAPVPLFEDAYAKNDSLIQVCDPHVYKMVDYNDVALDPIEGDLEFEIQQDCKTNALRFITKSILSMDLVTGKTTDWYNQHMVFPLDGEIKLKAASKMRIKFNYAPGDSIEKLQKSIQVDIVPGISDSNIPPNGSRRIVEFKPKASKPTDSSVKHY